MDIFAYLLVSILYITIIHFALAGKSQFKLAHMIIIFVLGAIVGVYYSFEIGFVSAIIASLIFW